MLDPFALVTNRPKRVAETREFPFQWDGKKGVLPITLRGLDPADGYVVQDTAYAYAAQYNPESESYVPIMLGGEAIATSFQICNAIARVLVAQESPCAYSFEQWAAWVVILGDAWNDVLAFADELDAKVKASGKGIAKDSGSSPQPQWTADSGTLDSSTNSSPSSTPSTTDAAANPVGTSVH